MTDFTIVLRSLRARAFSTIITILSVAIAVMLILSLLTLRNSGKAAFERGSGDMHLLITAEDSPLVSVLNSVFYANAPRRPVTWTKYQQIAAQAPWAYTVPTAIGDSYRGFPVVATTTDMFTKFVPAADAPWKLSEGAYFAEGDAGNWQAVLGSTVAQTTGLKIGDTIYLAHGYNPRATKPGSPDPAANNEHAHDDHDHDHADHDDYDADHEAESTTAVHVHREFPTKVVGILAPTATPHDRAIFTNLESTWIKHAKDIRARLNPPQDAPATSADLRESERLITGIYTRLVTRPGSDAPANLPQVFDTLRRDGSLTVAQPKQETDTLFGSIIDPINRIFVAIAVVVLITSGIGIMLALYNSMEQRRRQIAVLRVLGASASRIFNLVITECAVIGVAGALLGTAITLLGTRLAAFTIMTRYGVVIEPTLSPIIIIYLIVATILLAILAGLIPAIMAYRTSVARSLRPTA
ncbi:MAG TPA: ABC transporter permease [Phycisphaerales bacterium]|nr:ABC transporter permease [Phycisphaerales bacterium]